MRLLLRSVLQTDLLQAVLRQSRPLLQAGLLQTVLRQSRPLLRPGLRSVLPLI